MLWLSQGFILEFFVWWEWRRGGGGGGRGSGMEICCSTIFYLAEKAVAFLGVGIALLLHFPVFYRVLL